jgi:hypothetical protein
MLFVRIFGYVVLRFSDRIVLSDPAFFIGETITHDFGIGTNLKLMAKAHQDFLFFVKHTK